MPKKALTIPLNSSEAITAWKEAIAYDEQSDDAADADVFVLYYEKFLKDNPQFPLDFPKESAIYQDLYERALWIGLPFRRESDGYIVFDKYVGTAFKIPELDLWKKTKEWLTNFPLARRDEIKKRVFDSLLRSSVVVTSVSLQEPGLDAQPGTVGNWIRQYQGIVGVNEVDTLAKTQYFFTNKAFAALPVEERDSLKNIFVLVDHLKLSSKTPEGFEEDIVIEEGGKSVVITEGKETEPDPSIVKAIRDFRGAATPEERQALLVSLLRGSEQEVQTINMIEEEIGTQTGNNETKLRDLLFSFSSPDMGKEPEQDRTVATLKHLARLGFLENILRGDKRFFDLLVQYYQKTGRLQEVDDLKVYPTSPKHLSSFLQVLLMQRIGMRSADAARITVQIENILKKNGKAMYMEMAFFDEEKEQFAFGTPIQQSLGVVGVY